MEDRRCTVGMDLGTTSLKAVAFDLDGQEIARASREVERSSSEEGAEEEDPRAVATAATDALAAVVADAKRQGYTVGTVGLSAAMHSLIPVAADDSPLGPALLWMDTRPEAEADALWQTEEGRAAYERTGTPVSAMAPLVKLRWLRRARPNIYQRAARFVSLKEWLWHDWFGVWEVDTSIASATGLYNLRDQDMGRWRARPCGHHARKALNAGTSNIHADGEPVRACSRSRGCRMTRLSSSARRMVRWPTWASARWTRHGWC